MSDWKTKDQDKKSWKSEFLLNREKGLRRIFFQILINWMSKDFWRKKNIFAVIVFFFRKLWNLTLERKLVSQYSAPHFLAEWQSIVRLFGGRFSSRLLIQTILEYRSYQKGPNPFETLNILSYVFCTIMVSSLECGIFLEQISL